MQTEMVPFGMTRSLPMREKEFGRNARKLGLYFTFMFMATFDAHSWLLKGRGKDVMGYKLCLIRMSDNERIHTSPLLS
jgi:hypothetical protein